MADTDSSPDSKVSSAQLRKIKKPIIEKRRRERINESLNQVKTLVLDALNKDESRFSKMEKADILEMTVKHLKSIQQEEQQGSRAQSSTAASRYRAGFTECAHEVQRYLASVKGVSPTVHQRLVSHLETIATRTAAGSTTGNVQPKIEVASTSTTPATSTARVVNIAGDGTVPISKIPIATLRTDHSSSATHPMPLNCVNRNVPVLPLVANNATTVLTTNTGATSFPIQTLTLDGTQVLLTPHTVTMPTTVTVIRRDQCIESQGACEFSAGTAIPLYINTNDMQGTAGTHQACHSPGASDGESGGSFSPGSTTSSTSSHLWLAQPPSAQQIGPIKIQPQAPFLSSVWRPW